MGNLPGTIAAAPCPAAKSLKATNAS